VEAKLYSLTHSLIGIQHICARQSHRQHYYSPATLKPKIVSGSNLPYHLKKTAKKWAEYSQLVTWSTHHRQMSEIGNDNRRCTCGFI